MKLLHLADLHLGKRVNGFDLLEDQRAMLEQLLDLCDRRHPDAVLLAGDIYDAPVPPAAAVLLLDWFLTELAARGLAVLAVAGNHDSAERLDYAAGLLRGQRIFLAGQYTGAPRRVVLEDAFGPVTFDLLPFVRPATVRHFAPEAAIQDEDTALAAALAAAAPADGRRVLVAHQMIIAGGRMPDCAGSESCAADVHVGTVQAADAARLDGYCYAALGHIHRPQRVGRDTVRYAGSPLCYSLDECGAEKSAVVVTLSAAGAEPELVTLHPRRAMRHLTGPLDRLTDPAAVTDPEDYIWATLTDPTPRPDAMKVLRAAYPNAMKLDYALGAQEDGAGPAADAARLRALSFEELFGGFFEKMHGRPMTDAEAAALRTLREEAAL